MEGEVREEGFILFRKTTKYSQTVDGEIEHRIQERGSKWLTDTAYLSGEIICGTYPQ